MSTTVYAVVAVKDLDRAKSRLAVDLPPAARAELVLAMLSDTLTAVAQVPTVVATTVVTPDRRVADVASGHGAGVLAEPEHDGPADDAHARLNAALDFAARRTRDRHGPVDLLALQADLPALRADELADVVNAAPAQRRSLVVDHRGTGTAALLSRIPNQALRPRFGPASARRHLADDAIELAGDWPGLRLDVDTAADLDRAIELGVGSATRAVLAQIGWRHSRRVRHPVQ
jgi:2-phospho-L-lactate guanylyltransferase